MPKKIRVHELAKELGLTNKEALDLSLDLGIGVKTHSSSIEDAQADRVRRKAQREGLVRDEQPEEVKPAKKKAAKKKAAAKKATAKKTAATDGETPEAPAPAAATADTTTPGAPVEPDAERPSARLATPGEPSTAAEPETAPGTEPPPASRPAASDRPGGPTLLGGPSTPPGGPSAPPAAPRRKVTSSGSEHPPRREPPPPSAPERPSTPARPAAAGRPLSPPPPPAQPAARGPQGSPGQARPGDGPGQAGPSAGPGAGDAAGPGGGQSPSGGPGGGGATGAGGAQPPSGGSDAGGPPRSSSGKPIPPPPASMRSTTGKPIPPPPGMGGRGPAPTRTAPGPRPGPPRSNRPAVGGGPRTSVPGAGVPPGGRPGGGPGGGRPGGPPGRRPPRRRGRRRRSREELQPMDMPTYTPAEAPVPEGVVVIERASTPQELGPKLNRTAADVVRYLLQQGEMVTATQSLSDDMIELFAAEVGADLRLVDPGEEQEVELRRALAVGELDDDDGDEALASRPPVITVMGHVDHGKTKLLDQIRSANVVAGEAGGITQHIGAYQVDKDGRAVTFIDTPGHEAFTAMRARGAEATDIVILVVAADDGVMPQTEEALDHARAAGVPIVVAINKIDRENADPNRVLSQLAERDLVPEAWGGDTVVSEVSALENVGIDELLENLLVVAELEDLQANPEGRARGVVLEANLDVGRGPVATILVQRGTLRVGDPLVAGAAWGRVRALIDDRGEQIKEAGPSTPVQVLGLSEVAIAGDEFVVAPDDRTARNVAEKREHWQRVAAIGGSAAAVTGGARLEDIFAQIQAGETVTLNLIVKADVTGSLEAVTEALKKLERDDVKLAFARRGVGGVTKDDIQLAAASDATIIGFNVRPDRKARELAEQEQVEIRNYEVIYQLLEDVESAMVGMLAPELEEVVTGDAEVREVFQVPRVGRVAGCLVQNGVITRNSKVRFLREGTIIWKGTVSSLKRFKDDVTEVRAGFECGIGLSDFQDLKPGDIIETYDEREVERT